MSELRQDRTTGRLAIIAPGRRERPGATAPRPTPGAPALKLDPQCPFCPGSEARLPAVLAEIGDASPPGWRVRVVPNKYPAVDAPGQASATPGLGARSAAGLHEVVIESPRHDDDLAAMADDQLEAVVGVYRDRFGRLMRHPGVEAVVLFRNHGPHSGASLRHCHAQLLALDLSPPMFRALAETGAAHHAATGRCATCDMIQAELSAGVRVVEATPDFVALVPFAAERPSEIWVLPRRHQASFTDLDDARLPQFAHLLGRTLRRLKAAHGDPTYNFAFEGADRAHLGSPFVHWRLRIAPKLSEWGGFELGSGMAINPSSPEEDAARLRASGGEGS